MSKVEPARPTEAVREATANSVPTDGDRSFSRPPTVYESLVFHAMTRRHRPKVEPAKTLTLEQVLDRLAAEPKANARAEVAPLMADRRRREAEFIRIVQGAAGPRRDAAIRLLPTVAGRRSLPLLLELAGSRATHAVAVETLAPLADSSIVGRFAAAETDPALRSALATELLARWDIEAVREFLQLVMDRNARETALEALKRAKQPPVEVLFGFLQGTQQSERLAAAVALGRLDGPVITKRLIAMAHTDGVRQEALVALLASDSESASRFVNFARQDETLMAAVDAAQYQLLGITQ